ncbi:homoserine dehydrogenase [Clostridium tetanomorphum]|uniref:Homoserine dehydrogenase n=1 Tax=Clostridium tetanomorphum TaxID=1553 RepID=A0A923J0P5_CLOTT|nr:homoserine dehydrogenase [Clostridium tetanomorphum]KAJ48953.1 homoserine dehydrogenase [Clostridium tetanomorphum DSM 665]KAJ50517.1 homoserine dehydrogenase [Clostridium tetanomorphum DSM 665]MBC2398307.1 homoserine dehydrogenase [Clostridium tetanomorphum]MBP1865575.1 homoserine dehydrogenase [Clostridium tetanomorphum]NRS85919.1 homoserine dehydrogenase [Clostridium tetanomorphum]
MKKIKIGLLGLGNVGKGVWKILNMNREELQKRSGYDIEVSKILVKDINKDRNIDVPKEMLTTNFQDILNDDSIEIIVEVIGGIEPAVDYMISAMKSKKHIVTANKMAIATNGNVLLKTAKEEGVMFYYEASVGGGIPIIHGLKESLTANKIEEVIGIINGTTNYILTKMTLEGLSFQDALKEAQEKGYAEADPTADVEAFDAMYKLCILSSLAFDTMVNINSIHREGITNIKSIDIEYAKEFGYVIKLLAIVKERNGELELRVHPTMIPSTHPLANVNDSFNAVFIKGNAVGDLMLYGRGAGELPTGSAVVGDIVSILRNKENLGINFNSKSIDENDNIKDMKLVQSEYYVRITVKDKPGVLGEISTIFGKNNVSILSVIQKGKREEQVTLVFVTHSTLEGNINKSIDMIKALDDVEKIENIIRIENL